ncbi:MAG: hypothetical protein Q9207_006554 [Kuettlingeria erythrocarpa]
MAALSARQVFQPSCPQGGAWVACGFGSRFVGCCVQASAACMNGCSTDDLKPASFLKDRYLDVTGSVCPGDSLWYTCQNTDPTFMGCCTSDPCAQNGCPTVDFRAARLSTDEAEAGPYSAIPDPSSKMAQTSTQSQTSTSLAAEGPTSRATAKPSSSPSASRASIGAVIGATLGGLVLLSFLTSLAILLWRRRRGRRHTAEITAPPIKKGTPTSSHTTSTSAFSAAPNTPSHHSPPSAHELDDSSPGAWHAAREKGDGMPSPGPIDVPEKAHEMPTADLDNKRTVAGGGNNGLGTYQAFKPAPWEDGTDVPHELHG